MIDDDAEMGEDELDLGEYGEEEMDELDEILQIPPREG